MVPETRAGADHNWPQRMTMTTTNVEILRQGWLDAASALAPGLDTLPEALERSLEAAVLDERLDEQSLLKMVGEVAADAADSLPTDELYFLTRRLQRAVYEYLLSLDALPEPPPRRDGANGHAAHDTTLIGAEEVAALGSQRPMSRLRSPRRVPDVTSGDSTGVATTPEVTLVAPEHEVEPEATAGGRPTSPNPIKPPRRRRPTGSRPASPSSTPSCRRGSRRTLPPSPLLSQRSSLPWRRTPEWIRRRRHPPRRTPERNRWRQSHPSRTPRRRLRTSRQPAPRSRSSGEPARPRPRRSSRPRDQRMADGRRQPVDPASNGWNGTRRTAGCGGRGPGVLRQAEGRLPPQRPRRFRRGPAYGAGGRSTRRSLRPRPPMPSFRSRSINRRTPMTQLEHQTVPDQHANEATTAPRREDGAFATTMRTRRTSWILDNDSDDNRLRNRPGGVVEGTSRDQRPAAAQALRRGGGAPAATRQRRRWARAGGARARRWRAIDAARSARATRH